MRVCGMYVFVCVGVQVCVYVCVGVCACVSACVCACFSHSVLSCSYNMIYEIILEAKFLFRIYLFIQFILFLQ